MDYGDEIIIEASVGSRNYTSLKLSILQITNGFVLGEGTLSNINTDNMDLIHYLYTLFGILYIFY
jgi:hypothetical protein